MSANIRRFSSRSQWHVSHAHILCCQRHSYHVTCMSLGFLTYQELLAVLPLLLVVVAQEDRKVKESITTLH